MKLISKKFLTLACACATSFAPALFADDEVASPEANGDAAQAEKPKLVIELPTEVENINVKLTGLIQVQYAYTHTGGGPGSDQNGFSLRRTLLGATVNVGEDWSAKLTYEFDSKNNGGAVSSGYVDTATISKKFDDWGTLTVGHKKTHFLLEEYSPSSAISCIERSFNSNFITGNTYVSGLNSHHIGVFWDGVIESFDYGLSVTNAVSKDFDSRSNDLALTGNMGFNLELDKKSSIYFGLNATINFGDDGDNYTGTESAPLTNTGTVYGLEPYVRFKFEGLDTYADFFYINGSSGSDVSDLYGLNLTATYRLENNFEPAVRFTYLNTNSGLLNASTQNRVPKSDDHDNATTYYIGVNYYFNKYIKVSAGYEYGHYFGNGSADDSSAFRTMMQLSF